jgi:hypothetical protein
MTLLAQERRESLISKALKNNVTEPLAVASGLRCQLFQVVAKRNFIDSRRTLGGALNPLANASGSVPVAARHTVPKGEGIRPHH